MDGRPVSGSQKVIGKQFDECACIFGFWGEFPRVIDESGWDLLSPRIATIKGKARAVPKLKRAIDKDVFYAVGISELHFKVDIITALVPAVISAQGHFQVSRLLFDSNVF